MQEQRLSEDGYIWSRSALSTAELAFLDENLRIDGAWQTHIMQPRSAQKTNAGDPVGNWTAHGFVHEASFQASYFF